MGQIKLSDIRAKFPDYADVPDYQLLGALHKKFYSDIPRAQFLQAIDYDTSRQDPTAGNSFLDNALTGVGKGMSSIARAVGVSPDTMRSAGLSGTREEAAAQDAPLMRTAGGKVGNVAGQVALTAPAMLIPGANTYAGAALVGAGVGGLTTEGDLTDRAKGAVGGALGGLGGKGAGDLIGWGVPKLVDKLAAGRLAAQTANAQRDAAALAAREAGYVLPPSAVNPSGLNQALGGFSGAIQTAQAASAKNQDVTNMLARRALGIADDVPLTPQLLDQLRATAGKAYADISKLGTVDVTGKALPAGVKTTQGGGLLMNNKSTTADMGDMVNAWRQANADATAWFRAYARDANPESLTKAKSAAAAAKQLDDTITSTVGAIQQQAPGKMIGDLSAGRMDIGDFLKQSLANAQKGDLVGNLKAARQQIAKSYTVEKALNGTTGDVSAAALAKELAKGKPLSGDLLTAAQVAQAFPKATQALKEAPKAVTPLDYMAGLLGAGSTGGWGAAAVAARPAVRSLLLSKPYQGLLARPSSYSAGLLESALPALDNQGLLRSLPLGGGLLGIQLGQQ